MGGPTYTGDAHFQELSTEGHGTIWKREGQDESECKEWCGTGKNREAPGWELRQMCYR
jgi:hypothetical protein